MQMTRTLSLGGFLSVLPLIALAQDTAKIEWAVGGHSNAVFETVFSPSGALVASGSSDGTVKVWRTATGELVTTLASSDAFTTVMEMVRFTPDETGLLIGSAGGIQQWRLSDGERVLNFPTLFARAMDISPGGDLLVIAIGTGYGSEPRIDTISMVNGAVIEQRTGLNASAVRFTRDGSGIVVGLGGGNIRVLDADTLADLHSFTGEPGEPTALAISPDGQTLAVASSNVKLLSLPELHQIRTLSGHFGGVSDVAFSPDGSQLLSTGHDGALRVRTLTGQQIYSVSAHSGPAHSADWSPTGLLVSGGDEAHVKLWNAADGAPVRTFTRRTDWGLDAGVTAGGELLVVGEPSGRISVWNAMTGEFIRQFNTGEQYFMAFALSPLGDRVAVAGMTPTVKIFDVATGALVRSISGHNEWMAALAFSPDGQTIATTSADDPIIWQGFLRLHRVSDGALLRTINASSNLNIIRFSPDGSIVATGGSSVTAWDAASGAYLRFYHGHEWGLADFAFSPDGALLATAGRDRLIKLWNVANGTTVRRLTGHNEAVDSVTFSADGATLASSSLYSDLSVRLWDVASGGIVAHYEREMGRGSAPLLSNAADDTFILMRRDGTILAIENPSAALPADVNCDGLVNNFDIDPFVLALTDQAAYAAAFPGCDIANADLNVDGQVNNFDIDPFVACVSGGGCP